MALAIPIVVRAIAEIVSSDLAFMYRKTSPVRSRYVFERKALSVTGI